MRYFILFPTLFFCITTLYSNDNNFKYNFELYGISKISDQSIISSTKGDDYFIYIDKNKIAAKKKKYEEDYFLNFIIDFSYHNYESFLEVEKIRIDNDKDKLLFLAKENNALSINIMEFNNQYNINLIDELQLNFNKGDIVTNLKVMNIDRYSIRVFYFRNDKLCYRVLSIKDRVWSNETKLDIIGELIWNSGNYNIIKNIEAFELWYIGFEDDKFRYKYISNLSLYEVNNIKFTRSNNGLILTTNSKDSTTFYKLLNDTFEFKQYKYNTLEPVQLYQHYDNFFYGLKDQVNIISIDNFTSVESKKNIKTLNTLSFYTKDINKLTFIPAKNRYKYTSYDSGYTDIIDVGDLKYSILIDRYLFLIQTHNGKNTLQRYFLGNNAIAKSKDILIVNTFNSCNSVESINNIIHISESSLYFSFVNCNFFNSQTVPFVENDYVLYSNNEIYFLGYEGDSFEE